jgi:hypothetical protein
MDYVQKLNLIHFLDFYFMFFFFAGLVRRFGQYQSIGRLAFTGPGRWPRLLKLISEHRTLFVTWATVLPLLLTLLLSLVQIIVSRSVFPEAGDEQHGLTVENLLAHWPALFAVAPLGLVMLAVDIYGLVDIGEVNRNELEKYFDQAEYWLRSTTAHVVHVFTLGYINPRRMVAEEVQKSLVEASKQLNTSLWWLTVTLGLRMAFGLSLWLTWALTG